MKATEVLSVILLISLIFTSGLQAQQPGQRDPGQRKLRLEEGKAYGFEYGYRWNVHWQYDGEAIDYPNEQRIWYKIRVTENQDDTLYRCRLTVSRLFESRQTPLGFEVFDSRYPTQMNTGDFRFMLEGFTYAGTLTSQGKFTPDPEGRRLIDSLSNKIGQVYSRNSGCPDNTCFRERIKDMVFRNLGILQLFYPGKATGKWQPRAFAFEAGPTSDHIAGAYDVYQYVKDLEIIPRRGKHSLIRTTYNSPLWMNQEGPRADTVFIQNQSGFLSGNMESWVERGDMKKVRFSFYPIPGNEAIVRLNLADGISISDNTKYLLRQYYTYEEVSTGKALIKIPLDRPAIIELPDLSSALYIEPGDSLRVNVSADTSLEFEGRNARENRLMNGFFLQYGNWTRGDYGTWNREAAKNKRPEVFSGELKQELAGQRKALESIKYDLGPGLFTLLYNEYSYFQASRFANFLFTYHFLPEVNEADLDKVLEAGLAAQFLDFIKDIPLYNPDLMQMGYYYSPYNDFLQNYASLLRNFDKKDDWGLSVSNSGNSDILQLTFIKSNFGGYPYYFLTANALEFIAGRIEGRVGSYTPLFDEFLDNCNDPLLKRQVAIMYNFKRSLEGGNKFPDVSFADADNEPVSIRDLRGRKVLVYLITDFDMPDNSAESIPVIDSLNAIKDQFAGVDLVYLYAGSDPNKWKRLSAEFPEGVHLWHAPPGNSGTGAFLQKLRQGKALYQTPYFLVDKKQRIFKPGIINSASRSEDEAQRASLIKEFLERELQLFSLHRTSFLDPRLKRWGLLVLGVLTVTGLLSYFIIRWRLRSIRKKEAEKRRITEIELRAIRAQLNPHFIFNAMSSIQHLISSGRTEKASGYLSDLAVLMRLVLKHTEKGIVSLAEELETVKKYLALEQLRFSFQYEIAISEGIDVHNTLVPAMLLQPYVENAVLHGMSGKGSEGRLIISAIQAENRVTYTIKDNGPGIQYTNAASLNGNKMSLKIMKEKLKLVYGNDMTLEITDLAETGGSRENSEIRENKGSTGTRVEISLPAFI